MLSIVPTRSSENTNSMTNITTTTRALNNPAEKKKEKAAKEERREARRSRRRSLMVASIGILFTIGNIPNCIVYLFQQYVDTAGIFYRTFSITANMFLFAAQGSDIIVYYIFNHQYQKAFRKIFQF